MIEDRILVRKAWYQCDAECNAVCRVESVQVQIRWPSGGEPKHNGFGCENWTLLEPQPPAQGKEE